MILYGLGRAPSWCMAPCNSVQGSVIFGEIPPNIAIMNKCTDLNLGEDVYDRAPALRKRESVAPNLRKFGNQRISKSLVVRSYVRPYAKSHTLNNLNNHDLIRCAQICLEERGRVENTSMITNELYRQKVHLLINRICYKFRNEKYLLGSSFERKGL